MRTLLAVSVFVFACGGSKPRKESSMVSEGSDTSADCCCKTIPQTAEREIIPNYTMKPRMECSSEHGDCVDAVQCNASPQAQKSEKPESTPTETKTTNKEGVPPPPTLGPKGTGDAVPR